MFSSEAIFCIAHHVRIYVASGVFIQTFVGLSLFGAHRLSSSQYSLLMSVPRLPGKLLERRSFQLRIQLPCYRFGTIFSIEKYFEASKEFNAIQKTIAPAVHDAIFSFKRRQVVLAVISARQ
mmetsp:Transcript_4085/g.11229  ORF Transcript_4085/g.11229 Transcript_4085/m.11229 type:complete len:122 (-) Transcript_4085:156-521(-)